MGLICKYNTGFTFKAHLFNIYVTNITQVTSCDHWASMKLKINLQLKLKGILYACLWKSISLRITNYYNLHLLYVGKYSSPFYFRPFRLRCLRANLRISILNLFFFQHNCVWANWRRGETISKCKRAKIAWSENKTCI